jgi:hypothetical protein
LIKTALLKQQSVKIQLLDIQTSIFFSPEQTRSRSSPVPVPDIADIGSGENLVNQPKSEMHCVLNQIYEDTGSWSPPHICYKPD